MGKTCQHDNCMTHPVFNYPNLKKGIYCNIHKENGMIDVVNKTCKHGNCMTRPAFNYPNLKKGIYCSIHKENGMVDVVNKTCQHDNCMTQPAFNYPNLKKGIYCKLHKENGMVNVVNKTCQHDNCMTQPNFNYPNLKTGIYCKLHKENGMIDVKNKTCQYEWCDTRVSNIKYKGYCLRCFMYTFPNEKISRNYKLKEQEVSKFIKTEYPQYTILYDKQLGACSKRRPDIFIDILSHIIIVEIDENQHKEYDCTCENRRLMELSQDVDHRPIIFIRFNPDDYINDKNEKITSCFITNKQGFYTIKKSKINEWTYRLTVLKNEIEYWLTHKTEKTIEVINLFYDNMV